jgi:hypothetical protein
VVLGQKSMKTGGGPNEDGRKVEKFRRSNKLGQEQIVDFSLRKVFLNRTKH